MTWQTYRLSDVVESTQSGFASGEKNVADGFKHLRMNNIHADGRLDLSLVRTVPQELATAKYRLRQDDVLVCTTNSGKLVGKSAMFSMDGDFAFSNHLTRLRVRRDIAEPAFVQKQIWFKWLHGEIEPLCKHWVNQSTLPKEELLGLDVSLPDVEQQRRIVAKLNQITARIDDSRTRLDTIPTMLKRFRQSILAAACSGRLTADWRLKSEIHAIDSIVEGLADIPKKWGWVSIEAIGDVKGGKRLPKGQKLSEEKTGFPYIRAGQLKNGTVSTEDQQYLSAEMQDKIKRYTVDDGDVYITIVGACIGDAGVIPQTYHKANLTENAAKICQLKNIQANYLAYWLRSPVAQDYISSLVKSGAQGKLALMRIKEIPVPLPSLLEQVEIVRRVEALFKQADAIEARYKKARAFVEKLTPSVLAKAFRGELV